MSNHGPDRPEQYIVTFRTAGGEYRRCIDAFGISSLSELIRVEEKEHGSRFVAAILLE